jgi:hypothetical protein
MLTLSISQSVDPAPQNTASSKHTNVGAIVGGILGALALIFGILCFLFIRRRNQRQQDNGTPLLIEDNNGLKLYHLSGWGANRPSFHQIQASPFNNR